MQRLLPPAFFCLFAVALFAQNDPVYLLKKEADSLFAANKMDAAQVLYQQLAGRFAARQEWKEHIACRQNTSMVFILKGKSDSALLALSDAIYTAKNHALDSLTPELRLYKARAFIHRFDYGGAQSELDTATADAERYLPPGNLISGEIWMVRANIALAIQNYYAAREAVTRSLAAFKAAGHDQMDEVFLLYYFAAIAHISLLDFEECFRYARALDAWLNQLPPDRLPPSAPALIEGLGNMSLVIKQYDDAIDFYQKALALNQQLFGPTAPKLPSNYYNMGMAYLEKGEFAIAVQRFEQALESMKTRQFNVRLNTLIMSGLAKAYSGARQDSLAVEVWSNLTNDTTRQRPPIDMAQAYNDFSRHYFERRQYKEGLECLQKQKKLLDQNGNPMQLTQAAYRGMGGIYRDQKNYEAALTAYETAIRMVCADGLYSDAQCPNSDDIFIGVLFDYAETFFSRAMDAPSGEARTADLQKALAICRRGIALSEKFRQNFHRSREENFEWAKITLRYFEQSAKTAMQLFAETQKEAYREQAFALADRSKSLLLNEALKSAEARSFARVPDSLLQKEAGLSRLIVYLERKAAEAVAAKDMAAASQIQSGELFDAKRRYERLTEGLSRDFPDYHTLRYDTTQASVAEIRQKLPPKTLLIEYLVEPQQQKLYIFTIDGVSGLRTTVCPFDTQTHQRILELRKLLQSVKLPQTGTRRRFIALSHQMYRQYLQPIAGQMAGKTRLVVIGDGMTQALPFDALLPDSTLRPLPELDYLARRFAISYHYSARLYARSLEPYQSDGDRQDLLAFAPVFARSSGGALPTSARERAYEANPQTGRAFATLPYSEQEVKDISSLFRPQQTVRLLHGAAGEKQLKQQLAAQWRIVHIASHTFANINQPKFSGIACAEDTTGGEDGILYVNELYTLPIRANLVVLSSCESGIGRLSDGEGMLGLNRAFLYSGAKAIVFSLWQANDLTTSIFMKNFYRRIVQGDDYSEALAEAKRAMLSKPSTASPLIWANFQLIGQ